MSSPGSNNSMATGKHWQQKLPVPNRQKEEISALGLNPNRAGEVLPIAGKSEILLCQSTWSYPDKNSIITFVSLFCEEIGVLAFSWMVLKCALM